MEPLQSQSKQNLVRQISAQSIFCPQGVPANRISSDSDSPERLFLLQQQKQKTQERQPLQSNQSERQLTQSSEFAQTFYQNNNNTNNNGQRLSLPGISRPFNPWLLTHNQDILHLNKHNIGQNINNNINRISQLIEKDLQFPSNNQIITKTQNKPESSLKPSSSQVSLMKPFTFTNNVRDNDSPSNYSSNPLANNNVPSSISNFFSANQDLHPAIPPQSGPRSQEIFENPQGLQLNQPPQNSSPPISAAETRDVEPANLRRKIQLPKKKISLREQNQSNNYPVVSRRAEIEEQPDDEEEEEEEKALDYFFHFNSTNQTLEQQLQPPRNVYASNNNNNPQDHNNNDHNFLNFSFYNHDSPRFNQNINPFNQENLNHTIRQRNAAFSEPETFEAFAGLVRGSGSSQSQLLREQSFPIRNNNQPSVLSRFSQLPRITEASKKNSKVLTSSQIEEFPVIRLKVIEKDEICAVCIENLKMKELVKLLGCMHKFHTKCIDQWLEKSRICPVCNSDQQQFFQDDIPEVLKENNLKMVNRKRSDDMSYELIF